MRLDYKESWVPKNWCFWTVVLEKTLESPLDCKEIQPVNPKGNQSWIFIGRTDAEAKTPILWPPDVKNWFIWKDPDAGKGWRQEEKGLTEGEMVGRHHWLDGQEFEQALGAGDGQGGLACCSPWDCKELDMTEQLNWTGKKKRNPREFSWVSPKVGTLNTASPGADFCPPLGQLVTPNPQPHVCFLGVQWPGTNGMICRKNVKTTIGNYDLVFLQ